MLKKYQKYLERGDIPYFWNSENNLLCYVNYATTFNIANSVKYIIRKLETSQDPKEISSLFGKPHFILILIDPKLVL